MATEVVHELPCAWCQRGFVPRDDGGKPQRFCSARCRRAFDAAGRSWVGTALAQRRLGVDELVIAAAARRAVHYGPTKLPPLMDTDFEAAARRSAEAAELIDAILIALGELSESEIVVALGLFPASLVRRLYAWGDEQQ